MFPKLNHSWNLSVEEAELLQKEYAGKVVASDGFHSEIQTVAGVDVAYETNTESLVAAVVIIRYPSFEIIESVTVKDAVNFPYVPGLFSFREIPPIIKAFAKLESTPDLIVCDGHGFAHPRRFGLACHLGVLFDVPTIGCAKTNLLGRYVKTGNKRGAFEDIVDKGEVVGRIVWTRDDVNPVYVSIGHRISLPTACQWILRLTPRYRLPETTRKADQAANKKLDKI